jgi:hypothetical protein
MPLFIVGAKMRITQENVRLNANDICGKGFTVDELDERNNSFLKLDSETSKLVFKDYKCLSFSGPTFEERPFKKYIYAKVIHCPKIPNRSNNLNMTIFNLDNNAYILFEGTCHYCLKNVE